MRYFLLLFFLTGTSHWIGANHFLPTADTTKKKVRNLIFPLLGRAPETNWAFGAGTLSLFKMKPADTLLRTSTIPLGLIYTVRHQIIAGAGANLYFPGEKYILRFEGTYTKFPDKFWGLGYNTPNSNLENYTFSQVFLNPQFLRKVYKDYFVGVSYEYQHVAYIHYDSLPAQGGMDRQPSRFDQEDIVGRHGGHVSGLGIELTKDSRNNTFSASKGYLIKFQSVVFNNIFGSNFNFFYTEIDIRRYIEIRKNNVLCFQYNSTFTSGDVPYRNLAVLGGSNIMRGYYSGRYRDKNVAAVQAEYRMPIWWRFGAVAFAGLGQVSSNLTQWHLNNLKYSLGGGIRFAILPKEKLNLRVDYGFGYHSQNYYVTVTESF